jgi:hypothetical protein
MIESLVPRDNRHLLPSFESDSRPAAPGESQDALRMPLIASLVILSGQLMDRKSIVTPVDATT